MHPNAELIDGFYRAFAARDHAAMARAYSDDAEFSDPVFPSLRGPEIGAMWRMLCERGTDLEVTWSDVRADDDGGAAHWEARYTFTPTGRPVHNVIDATFEMRDGLIVRHRDDFDFYRWSRMALGPLGIALGWTPFVRAKVGKQAAHQLVRFRKDDRGGRS